MERLLFISSRPIFPIIGGDQIRTAQQLDFLTQRYIVDVLYISSDESNEPITKFQPKINAEYRFAVPKWKNYFQTLKFLFNKLPLQVNYFLNNNVQSWVKNHLENYNAVFCNNIRTAEYVRQFSNVTKYLDFVDSISMNYDKARHKATGIKKLIYIIDFYRVRNYEQLCLEAFDSCAVISDIDNQYIMSCK